MKSEKIKIETVADVVERMREYARQSKKGGGEIDVWRWLNDYADSIEAAHKNELLVEFRRSQLSIDEMVRRLVLIENYVDNNAWADSGAKFVDYEACMKVHNYDLIAIRRMARGEWRSE